MVFDECNNVNIRTEVGKYFVGRSISKFLKKRFGWDISIKINELSLMENGRTTTGKISVNLVMDTKDYEKMLLKIVDEDMT